nr:PREDICTED: uncharacterized protein LOC109036917 [Bemisia tabaci]
MDYPMFAPDRTCYSKQEIVNADPFRNFLPSDVNQREHLTDFFCCTNPKSCIFKDPINAIDNYFPVIRDILQKCIAEDKKPPPSKRELKSWKSQKGSESQKPASAPSSKLAKSKSYVYGLFGRWNGKRTGKPMGSMRGFSNIGNVITRQGSGNSYTSDSDSENDNTSPNRSSSNSPSRSNSQSRGSSPGRQLSVEGDDPSRNLKEEYEAAERDLDDVMKIMLNRLIDPCVLMYEMRRDNERTKVLQKTCQTYCEFLGVATGRLTTRGTLKLAIDLIKGRPKHLVTCKKFDYGGCVKREKSNNHFCKCHKKDKKGRLDSGRRMVLCDNHLRNFLTPISMCK